MVVLKLETELVMLYDMNYAYLASYLGSLVYYYKLCDGKSLDYHVRKILELKESGLYRFIVMGYNEDLYTKLYEYL